MRTTVLLLVLLVSGNSAIDIARILGLRGDDTPKEVPQTPEQAGPTEQRQILQQLGAALAPLAPVAPVIANLPSLASQLRPTVTRTVFIQVTATHTKYPVCMTAYGVKPPCAALAAPPAELHEQGHHHENLVPPHEAYLVGQNQAVLGYELQHNPQLGLAGYIPQPTGHEVHEESGDYDNEHWEYKDAHNIEPTAASRMPEATAMFELGREKREVELEASSVTEPETEVSSSMIPHPRYLIAADPIPVTLTKTLYMTKVEKHTDHHVTATLVAQNCIPDHIPFCPSAPNPVVYASPVPVPYPVYVNSPVQQHPNPLQHPNLPADLQQYPHVPQNHPEHQAPLRPGEWHLKNVVNKNDDVVA